MGQLIVGTYTQDLPHVTGKADGILAIPFSREGRESSEATLVVPVVNPSWVVANRLGTRVYGVLETVLFEGVTGGGVVALARDLGTGSFTDLGSLPSGGEEPAHLALDADETFLLVTNYGAGTVVAIALDGNGALGEQRSSVQHVGSSVDAERQASPHPHQVVLDAVSGRFFVPDLGLDAVVVYDLSTDGMLSERVDLRLTVPPGSGPRHLAFHPDGRHLFVLNELSGSITLFERVGEGFGALRTQSTLPAEFRGHNQAAEIHIAARGRWVWVSHRGLDAIVTLEFDAATASLVLRSVQPSRGLQPRDFVLTADERQLLVANQDSDILAIFEVRPDGSLGFLRELSAPTPVCLLLIEE